MALRIQPKLKAKKVISSFIFQTFTPYQLSSFLSAIAIISCPLTTHITVQILQVTVFNVLRFDVFLTVHHELTTY
jgi:hypothetical protein